MACLGPTLSIGDSNSDGANLLKVDSESQHFMAVFCQEKRHCTRSSTPQYQEICSKPCSLADSGSFVSIAQPQLCLTRKGETIGPRYWAAPGSGVEGLSDC